MHFVAFVKEVRGPIDVRNLMARSVFTALHNAIPEEELADDFEQCDVVSDVCCSNLASKTRVIAVEITRADSRATLLDFNDTAGA